MFMPVGARCVWVFGSLRGYSVISVGSATPGHPGIGAYDRDYNLRKKTPTIVFGHTSYFFFLTTNINILFFFTLGGKMFVYGSSGKWTCTDTVRL